MEKSIDNTDTVNVTIKKPTRVLHFSDGVDEEIEEERSSELKAAPDAASDNIDPVSNRRILFYCLDTDGSI